MTEVFNNKGLQTFDFVHVLNCVNELCVCVHGGTESRNSIIQPKTCTITVWFMTLLRF